MKALGLHKISHWQLKGAREGGLGGGRGLAYESQMEKVGTHFLL